jgi:hypothetical protein
MLPTRWSGTCLEFFWDDIATWTGVQGNIVRYHAVSYAFMFCCDFDDVTEDVQRIHCHASVALHLIFVQVSHSFQP